MSEGSILVQTKKLTNAIETAQNFTDIILQVKKSCPDLDFFDSSETKTNLKLKMKEINDSLFKIMSLHTRITSSKEELFQTVGFTLFEINSYVANPEKLDEDKIELYYDEIIEFLSAQNELYQKIITEISTLRQEVDKMGLDANGDVRAIFDQIKEDGTIKDYNKKIIKLYEELKEFDEKCQSENEKETLLINSLIQKKIEQQGEKAFHECKLGIINNQRTMLHGNLLSHNAKVNELKGKELDRTKFLDQISEDMIQTKKDIQITTSKQEDSISNFYNGQIKNTDVLIDKNLNIIANEEPTITKKVGSSGGSILFGLVKWGGDTFTEIENPKIKSLVEYGNSLQSSKSSLVNDKLKMDSVVNEIYEKKFRALEKFNQSLITINDKAIDITKSVSRYYEDQKKEVERELKESENDLASTTKQLNLYEELINDASNKILDKNAILKEKMAKEQKIRSEKVNEIKISEDSLLKSLKEKGFLLVESVVVYSQAVCQLISALRNFQSYLKCIDNIAQSIKTILLQVINTLSKLSKKERTQFDKPALVSWVKAKLPDNKILEEKIAKSVADGKSFVQMKKKYKKEEFMQFFGVDEWEMTSLEQLISLISFPKEEFVRTLNRLERVLNNCVNQVEKKPKN